MGFGVEESQWDDCENNGAMANLVVATETADDEKIVKPASSSKQGLSSGGGASTLVLG
eukprot:NODE_7819_length_418_cov_381.650138.p5 GENE.NODE_7819_length_418_cov_381.650138~~NODE_7819_length_418_cov_381.650138.p5  ORF type:complete len:58 (+),score=20.74 NODE_7819_length_418_cov_381.650138:3-176(+)